MADLLASPSTFSVLKGRRAIEAGALELALEHDPVLLQQAKRCELDAESPFLIVALSRSDEMVAAMWGQINAGNLAHVSPPVVVAGESESLTQLLAGEMEKELPPSTNFIQSTCRIPHPQVPTFDKRLRSIGFELLTDMEYLIADCAEVKAPRESLIWRRVDPAQQRLRTLLEASYRQSFDCPELDYLRDLDDSLVGYEATGTSGSEHWFAVEAKSEGPVGCILLARHSDQIWELVYMGVSPEFRGRGFGETILRRAMSYVRGHNGRQIMLGVDQRNPFARRIYLANGFTTLENRRVWYRCNKQPKPTHQ